MMWFIISHVFVTVSNCVAFTFCPFKKKGSRQLPPFCQTVPPTSLSVWRLTVHYRSLFNSKPVIFLLFSLTLLVLSFFLFSLRVDWKVRRERDCYHRVLCLLVDYIFTPCQINLREGQVALRYYPSTLFVVCFHTATMPWLDTKCKLPMFLWANSCPLGPLHYISASSPTLLCHTPFTMFSLMHWEETAHSHTSSHCGTLNSHTHAHLFRQPTQNRNGHLPSERLSQQPCFHIILSLHSLGHEIMWVIASKCLLSHPSTKMRVAATLRASWLI